MGALPSLKRAWVAGSESQRIERFLAAARAFLALAALVAMWIDPTGPRRYATVAYALLSLYVLEAVGVLAMVRSWNDSSFRFRLTVHAIDVIWPALISVFTSGPDSPFYLFYTFVLLEAAYRWGLQATLATALVATALFISQTFFVSWHINPTLAIFKQPMDANAIMRGVYLLIMGYLLGYLGEEEQQLRNEASSIARVMAKVRAEVGMRGALQAIFDEMFDLFRSRRALLTVRDHNTGRAFVWEARKDGSTHDIEVTASELEGPQVAEGIFDVPGHVWHVARDNKPNATRKYDVFALDEDGRMLEGMVWSPPESLADYQRFHSLIGVRVSYTDEWSGPMLLFDPKLRSSRETAVRFLRTLAVQVGPAIYSVFLTSRLRSRAGAIERARVSRELHDGVIQSMIGLEMEIDVLRRKSASSPSEVAERLGHVQKILRQEVLNLRELMQQMKPVELRPKQLLDFLAITVDKFRRDTGIPSQFVSMLSEVSLQPRVCNELARIVQEALANVRKHSGAGNVVVQLGYQDRLLKLVIDDNGRGFDFSGRLNLVELDVARKGPISIKERIRSIGGDLTIESLPGKGSRLEVFVPQREHG